MASVRQRLLVVTLFTCVTSTAGTNIFRNVVDMVLHPKETLDAAVLSAKQMAYRIPDTVLVKALENSQGLLRRPHPLLGIPTLDPYSLSHMNITHNLTDISEMEGYLDDVTVRGLSSYSVKQLAVNWTSGSVKMRLYFPTINAVGFYYINGTFAEFLPVFGDGHFRLKICDLELNTTVCLRYVNSSLQVTAIDLDYRFAKYQSYFGGLMGGQETGELVNDVINEKAPQLLRSLMPVVKPIALHHILGGLNARLRLIPLSHADLLSWVPGASRLQQLWYSTDSR